MCTVSMIGDHYGEKFRREWPQWFPTGPATGPEAFPNQTVVINPVEVSRAEFDQLKRDVAEMRELLKRAKAYDERNGEPDCEIDEKMDLLRKVAKLVGVDLDDVLGTLPNTEKRA